MRLHQAPQTANLTWDDQIIIAARPETGEAAPVVPWRPVAQALGARPDYASTISGLDPFGASKSRATIATEYLWPWEAHPAICAAAKVDNHFRESMFRTVALLIKAIDVAQLDPEREFIDFDMFALTDYLERVARIGQALRLERTDLSHQGLPATILRALYEITYATFPYAPAAEARLLAHGSLWVAVYGFSPATAAALGVESGI